MTLRLSTTHLPLPAIAILFILICSGNLYAQLAPCPQPVPQSVGTHRFRQAGESFNIPVIVGDCQPVALELRWSNGPNNGSNFTVTFLDDNSQPIYSKLLWGFMTGNQQFPFLNMEAEPWLGNQSMMAVPAMVTIQAVQPFAPPSSIYYRLTRIARRSDQIVAGIDDKLAATLRMMPGTVVAESQLAAARKYRVEDLSLDAPREMNFYGKKERIEKAYRLTISGGPFSDADLIWINDAVIPAFWGVGNRDLNALIYDSSLLKDGAEICFSRFDGTSLSCLSERLKLPFAFKPTNQPAVESGNSIVAIRNAVRTIGTSRQSLIQLDLTTTRPFPARDKALQLQIGKHYYLTQLSGDYTGRNLTLTLTPEMFAELADGSDVVAFFNIPDRSGASNEDAWYFGRLNKSLLAK